MPSAPFDWAEYLRLAEALANKSDEASQRTAISRAYYFVYHIASARAVTNGYPSGQQSHAKIWKLYQDQSDFDARRLATRGTAMKRVRESADYKAVVALIPDQLAQQLIDAKEFLQKLTNLPTNIPIP